MRRLLLAIFCGVLLLGLALWSLFAAGKREVTATIASVPGDAVRAANQAPPAILPPQAEHEAASATLLAPENVGRREVEDEELANRTVDVLVRIGGELTPIAKCELIYIDGSEANVDALEQVLSLHGFDLDRIRKLARSTFTDERGHARVVCPSGWLDALAISETHFGMVLGHSIESNGPSLTIDCFAARFVTAQVVDTTGRALDGVPICLYSKGKSFLNYAQAATTKAPNGLARLGPITLDETNAWTLKIIGSFPRNAGVDVDLRALPADPIRIVMPDCGSIEVRLLPRIENPVARSAKVGIALEPGEDLHVLEEVIGPGSKRALFERIALGLVASAEVRFDGVSRAFLARSPGPRTAGERVVIEVPFDTTLPQLSGRLVYAGEKPLCEQVLNVSCHVQVGEELVETQQFSTSDPAGILTLDIDAAGVSRAPAALLIREYGFEPTLGAVLNLELSAGPNDLGTVQLTPPELLAAGRVVDEDGVGVNGILIELQKSIRPLGVGWALRSQTNADGDFELRGWWSEGTLRIAPKGFGALMRPAIETSKGFRGLRIPVQLPPAPQH